MTVGAPAWNVAVYNQFKAGYHGKNLDCNATSDVFQDCATCTAGCRVAFCCVQIAGRFRDEFNACVAEYSLPTLALALAPPSPRGVGASPLDIHIIPDCC